MPPRFIDMGEIMTTEEMQELYIVVAFSAPLVEVIRKSDGAKGTLEFSHSPRRYFDFVEA
jgi:hypothetical protein